MNLKYLGTNMRYDTEYRNGHKMQLFARTLKELNKNDEKKWNETKIIATKSLDYRKLIWDDICEQIKSPKQIKRMN